MQTKIHLNKPKLENKRYPHNASLQVQTSPTRTYTSAASQVSGGAEKNLINIVENNNNVESW